MTLLCSHDLRIATSSSDLLCCNLTHSVLIMFLIIHKSLLFRCLNNFHPDCGLLDLRWVYMGIARKYKTIHLFKDANENSRPSKILHYIKRYVFVMSSLCLISVLNSNFIYSKKVLRCITTINRIYYSYPLCYNNKCYKH